MQATLQRDPYVFRRRFTRLSRGLASLAALLVLSSGLSADDDNDTLPGLLAHYRAGGKTVAGIDPDVAFQWKTDSPDPRLPHGPFAAAWTGQLLVREGSPFRFHAYLAGKVTVKIGGKTVLAGESQAAGWINGEPAELSFGEKPLEITFDAPGQGAGAGGGQGAGAAPGAVLKLFWSSARFPLEPLPAHLLFCDESANAERKDIVQLEAGRRAFEIHRCNSCHHRPQLFSPAAPSLVHVADGLSAAAIIEKVGRQDRRPAEEVMPTFPFTADEAGAIAAFLVQNSEPASLEQAPESTNLKKEARKGETLVSSLGCLACHAVPGRNKAQGRIGNAGAYGGGNLSAVGSKRSADWLWTWLDKPGAINADHRMPTFNLKKKERRQIVSYLSALRGTRANAGKLPSTSPPNQQTLVARGRALVVQALCAACHRIKDVMFDTAGLADLSQPVRDWNKSCLSQTADRSRLRPAYSSADFAIEAGSDFRSDSGSDPASTRGALIAFVKANAGPLSAEAASLRGERLLERKQCVACHTRGGSRGLGALAAALARGNKSLKGGAETLVPPNLTAVGDKLNDQALAEAVEGGGKKRRLPWLAVHMPRFEHTDDERAALLAAFISRDRVPDGAPESAAARTDAALARAAAATSDEEESRLVAGQRLVGTGGFSCIACHDMGTYAPKNVAVPTHGSDLIGLGRRMRREFFLRWTRAPLRIRPGMEMPSYERPVAGVLHGDLPLQLSALWDALNDPRFTPPINPSSVEQFLVVAPGGPARIVRDVFSKRGDEAAVARAFAVGFNNGHSLLFDLDLFCLRDWTVGDFARQRTSGKSWFWNLAGLSVGGPFNASCDLALATDGQSGAAPLLPQSEFGSVGRLTTYRQKGEGVELRYQVRFHVAGKPRMLDVRETWAPLPAGPAKRAGVLRQIEIPKPIAGHHVLVRVPRIKFLLDGGSIEAREAGAQERGFIRLAPRSGTAIPQIGFEYRCAGRGTPSVIEPANLPKLVPETVDCVPGFEGVRLPLDRSIMPTAIAWTADGKLAFTSLKGHVYRARDTDGDGIEDRLDVLEEGLAAPYGLLAEGRDLVVAHKPELLRLSDINGDGRANRRTVVATGWGYSENYHDWTCGLVRDSHGSYYVGLGSDYSQKNRSAESSRWRGKILRIDRDGTVTPIAHALRYPTGLAADAAGRLFATDNQGDQNPYNELNHIVEGRHYGVPSLYEENRDAPVTPPAVEIPHPWTRSVNGICFLPRDFAKGTPAASLAGQGIGCEYNGRFLVRFSIEEVEGTVQGAVYPFSRPDDISSKESGARPSDATARGFMGPLCCAVSPRGDLLIGGIQDSGWLGGANVGEIVRLRPSGKMPNGLKEIRVTPHGFEISFFEPVDANWAREPSRFSLIGSTRTWAGGYATPDTGRHRVAVRQSEVVRDGRTIRLVTDGLREGYVYEVTCSDTGSPSAQSLWPRTASYTLHRVPKADQVSASPSGRK